MATGLWFRSALLGNIGTPDPLWNTSGIGGYWWTGFDSGRGFTPGATTLNSSSTPKGLDGVVSTNTTVSQDSVNTVTGTTAGIYPGANPDIFFSPVVGADFTLSGTITFGICAFESAMNANASVGVALYRLDAQGGFTLIIKSTDTVGELGTTLAKRTWTGTPTSTAMKKGDRICAVVYFTDGGGTMASGFSCTFGYNANAANVGDSNFSLTENVTWASAPSGTEYHLRSTASDIAGKKAMSTSAGAGAATAVHTSQTGPRTYPGDQWTDTAGGSAIEWLTPPLNAFTLGGVVKCNLSFASQPGSGGSTPFDGWLTEIAIVDQDGVSNPSIWSRSYHPIDYSLGWPQTYPHYCGGPDTSVGQGKRLRFRIYHEDMSSANNSVSGTNRTLNYDGTGTSKSSLVLPQSVTEATLGPVAKHSSPPDLAKKGMVVAVNRASFW